jgi:predicted O-methyltransferase YrrM
MKYLPGEKYLMPFQDQPFNGDRFAVEKFLSLKQKFGIETAIELGTCVGGTTRWLSQNFKKVIGIEIMFDYLSIAAQRVNYSESDVTFYEGSTVDILPKILKDITEPVIIFADSHWGEFNPLIKELEIIADHKLKPVLVVHDFLVPGRKELGYDTYKEIVYEWKWIEPSIRKIYGDEFVMEYNSKAAGAKRGICYVYPK